MWKKYHACLIDAAIMKNKVKATQIITTILLKLKPCWVQTDYTSMSYPMDAEAYAYKKQ